MLLATADIGFTLTTLVVAPWRQFGAAAREPDPQHRE